MQSSSPEWWRGGARRAQGTIYASDEQDDPQSQWYPAHGFPHGVSQQWRKQTRAQDVLDRKHAEITEACADQEMLTQARQGVIAKDAAEDDEGHH
jgi:hypothetical protein